MRLLSSPVGKGAANLPDDVLLVQGLLRQEILFINSPAVTPPPPTVTGKFDSATDAALKWFLSPNKANQCFAPPVKSAPICEVPGKDYSPLNFTPGFQDSWLYPMSNAAWQDLSRFMVLPRARGGASELTEAELISAAKTLDCELAALKAVAKVEAPRGPWIADGRPTILYERHVFARNTSPTGLFDSVAPDVSSASPGGYGAGGAHQYDRLEKAMSLDRQAALKAASYGRFQVLGENFKAAGYSSVEAMVTAMFSSVAQQLSAMVQFVKSRHLAKHLKNKDWAAFALGYNGKNYKINNYDVKLEEAYKGAI